MTMDEIATTANKKLHSSMWPFVLVFRLYGIDLRSSANPHSNRKLKTCCNYLHSTILACLIIVVAVAFLEKVDFLELDIASKCLSVAAFTISISAAFNILVFNLKRRNLTELTFQIRKLVYLIEKYRPRHFRDLKILSYCLTLSPFVIIVIFALLIPIYVKVSDPNDSLVGFFHMFLEKSISDCKEDLRFVNHTEGCYAVLPIVTMSTIVIWATSTFVCSIHFISFIVTFNVLTNCFFQCAQQTYAVVTKPNGTWVSDPSAENARKFIILHKEISNVVKIADRAFREITFVISAAEMLIVIMSLRCMDFTNQFQKKVIMLLPITIVLTITFAGRTLCMAKVNYQVNVSIIMIKFLAT